MSAALSLAVVGALTGPTATSVANAVLAIALAAAVAGTMHTARLGPVRRVPSLAVPGAPAARGARRARRRPDRHPRRAHHDVAQVVDLLAVAVAAGCNVRLAVEAVVRSLDGPAVDALRTVLVRVDAGVSRLGDALADLHAARPPPPLPRTRRGRALGDRVGSARPAWVERAAAVARVRTGRSHGVCAERDALRSLGRLLADAERYGTPLAPALERLASGLRDQRRRRAEIAARRLPVQLLLPLVCCVLPAFALLTVAPLLVSGLRALTVETPALSDHPPSPITTEVPPP